eukprot:6548605-Prymnesium_polylepis.1
MSAGDSGLRSPRLRPHLNIGVDAASAANTGSTATRFCISATAWMNYSPDEVAPGANDQRHRLSPKM